MRPFDLRLLPHLRPARAPLALMVAATTAGGLLLLAQAFAVADLVVAALDGAPLGPPAVVLVAVTAARALTGWLGDAAAGRSATRVGTVLRRRVVAAALALGPAALSRRRSGELALLATRGTTAVEPYLTRYLPALVVAAVLPPAAVLLIAGQDLLSALVVVLTLPLVPVFAALVGLATRDRAREQWQLLAALSGHFLDVVRGLPTLVAYNRATAQSGRIRAITDRYRSATQCTLRLAFASSAVLELVATLSVALVAVLVGLRLAHGSLDLRTALVVLLLAPEAYWPLRRVGAEFHAAAEGTATFEAVEALLEEAGATPPAPLHRSPDAPAGLTLDRVTVTYPDRAAPVLREVSGWIPPTGLTAITGPSGCGKTTLLTTLLGHLSPAAGALRLGGAPALRQGKDRPWAEQVAWLPQRPWLLPGTVRDNVRLGRPDADDAAVWAALEQVRLAHHVAASPLGLDSPVEEDGLNLSAGERARLALARVVVADRPWVLLDEPTAHLDRETEEVVADTLVRLASDRAVVVVAHRPALVALADHRLVLPAAPVVAPIDPATAPAGAVSGSAPPAASSTASAAAAPAPATSVPAAPSPATSEGPAARHDAGLRLLALLLGSAAAASGVALTATAGWLIARSAEQPPVLMLMVAIVAVRTFGLARPVLRYAERLVSHDAALRLLAERRVAVYDALVPLVPGRVGRDRGELLGHVVDDVDAVVDRELRVRAPLVTAGSVGLLALAWTWWTLPAALVPVAALLLGAAPLAWLVARAGTRHAERRLVEDRAAVSSWVTTVLQGAADLLAWQATGPALDRLDRLGGDLGHHARQGVRAVAAGRVVLVIASGMAVAAVASTGAPALAAGTVSGPALALMLLLPLALLDVLLPVADAAALGVRTRAAAARLDHLTGLEPAVRDRPGEDRAGPAVPVGSGGATPARIDVDGAEVRFDGRTLLATTTLTLAPGEHVGVVGPSGVGKSTLAALLLRFLDPTGGEIRLDDTPLPRYPLTEVRSRVGLVDDDPHVFASTVAENVRLARPDADDAAVERALRAAHLGPWLDGLPAGLATRLGDGAAAVSGGERARLATARALLGDRQVLVLDEPTAHLDAATAIAVAEELLSQSGRSLVWITHGTVGLDRMDHLVTLTADVLIRPDETVISGYTAH